MINFNFTFINAKFSLVAADRDLYELLASSIPSKPEDIFKLNGLDHSSQ